MLLIIGILLHLVWLGVSDLFFRGGAERRAQSIWYAFMLGFMWFCCRALTIVVPMLYTRINDPYFWRFFWPK
jgi:hypothetical protein